ncbi:MAG: hypothetical protein IPK84_01500 [Candidatus Moraniibacteriota bacterium]|nr:MAG: hypothetical protein IPK84_01500 [Candidatus Moranbacteria bacterium]
MSVADWAFVVDVVHRLRDILELSIGEVIILQRAIQGRFRGFGNYFEEVSAAIYKSSLSDERKIKFGIFYAMLLGVSHDFSL